jgi:ubiquinone/menaquinone biosynthesis C-methylase UbiE
VTGGYLAVTEVPGAGATGEQLAMLYTRYNLAAGLAKGGDVLEVGCGPGMGLGYLAAKAKRVTGGDYDEKLLKMGRAHYGARIPLIGLDAHALPFRDKAFDLVILFEAIYYLGEVDRFLAEVRRVLRSGGVVLICSANRERHGFRPSPFSAAYYSAAEFRGLLTRHGFTVELYAAFPVRPALRRNSRSAARWMANAMRLAPGAKVFVKRILFGKPIPYPAEVTEGMADLPPLVPFVDDSRVTDFQVLYAIGRLR